MRDPIKLSSAFVCWAYSCLVPVVRSIPGGRDADLENKKGSVTILRGNSRENSLGRRDRHVSFPPCLAMEFVRPVNRSTGKILLRSCLQASSRISPSKKQSHLATEAHTACLRGRMLRIVAQTTWFAHDVPRGMLANENASSA
jgi:hypothetical protein